MVRSGALNRGMEELSLPAICTYARITTSSLIRCAAVFLAVALPFFVASDFSSDPTDRTQKLKTRCTESSGLYFGRPLLDDGVSAPSNKCIVWVWIDHSTTISCNT